MLRASGCGCWPLTRNDLQVDAVRGERAAALADIAEWLDHVAGLPETDSPTGNLVEAVLVGLAEALCPELVGSLRAHWMAES